MYAINKAIKQTELIETLWNVNPHGSVWHMGNNRGELIETLWNVNELSLLVAVLGFTELIETLWNVNLISCVFLSSHKTN